MKTEELVAVLARSAPAVDPRQVERRFALCLALALLAALAAVLLLLGPRDDWRAALQQPAFWAKLAFPAATAAATFVVLHRLGLPGSKLGGALPVLAVPLLATWLLAAAALAQSPRADWAGMVLGHGWWQCSLAIALVAVPAFLCTLPGLRGLAPTRLALAGAATGLFAGSVAALAYALACNETQAPFVAVWYALGMLLPAGVGAAWGRRLLRW